MPSTPRKPPASAPWRRDLAQLLPDLLPELVDKLAGKAQLPPAAMAYHPPCTLQHGQKLKGVVEANLSKLGFTLQNRATEAHLVLRLGRDVFRAAGRYRQQLRQRKLGALGEAFTDDSPPAAILSANIGCISHLQAGTSIPVRHWVEVLRTRRWHAKNVLSARQSPPR